ncbi:MAG: peptidoglycan-binding protein [Bdellovibrionaceae bacterium]|nr:peptidoglycan-binding protein [Pseudobdellovibrionaceae bacterium]MBX3035062.1 peptidoglycan-binding protein [Pseudobdellovibrionaceae bacterium]
MMTFRHLLTTGAFIAAAVTAQADGSNKASTTSTGSEPLSARSWEQSSPTYLSSSEIRRLQTALNEETTASVKEDGLMGPQTRAAIRQFQVENSLSVTGDADTATLQALGVSTDAEMERLPASVDDSEATSP